MQGHPKAAGFARPAFVAKTVPGYFSTYRLISRAHTGRVYQIWQAHDDAYDRVVGIKTVLEAYRNNREQEKYLCTECQATREVVHPRIIEVYGFDPHEGSPYLAMEWFDAPNMKQRIQQGIEKLSPLLSKIILQSAEAVACVHCKGWIHRDIKPDNFLVADDGTVKLIDFALAVREKQGFGGWLSRRFSKSSKVQGTRSYMAPEQIRGDAVDARTDLYSLACTVYELLAGKPPFWGADSDELLTKHLKTPPPWLEVVSPFVSPELSQLIRRSMAKDPAERPETVGDFLREFRMMRPFRAAKSLK
jgi:eukaryotic-like serine/threonine-protein kinase